MVNAMSLRHIIVIVTLGIFGAACGGTTLPAAPTPTATTPPPVATTPQPLDSITIAITPNGFRLITSTTFPLDGLRVFQGATLTFVNNDVTAHDVLSDPQHLHTDCPEINAAGFLLPGQSRSTAPLTRLRTCGFHDHMREGNPSFMGSVSIEARP